VGVLLIADLDALVKKEKKTKPVQDEPNYMSVFSEMMK